MPSKTPATLPEPFERVLGWNFEDLIILGNANGQS